MMKRMTWTQFKKWLEALVIEGKRVAQENKEMRDSLVEKGK